jgi:hypothetical protein
VSFSEENRPLFSLSDASERLSGIAAAVQHAVDRIDASDIRAHTNSELAIRVVQDCSVHPLRLIAESRGITSFGEVAVTPGGGWCAINDSFRPSGSVRGVRLKVTMRYEGLENLWSLKPSAEWAEEVHGNVHEESDLGGFIEIIFNVPGHPSKETITSLIDAEFEKVSRGVSAIASVIQQWNESLEPHALTILAERRQFLDLLVRLPELIEIPLIVQSGRVTYEPIELRRRAIEVVTIDDEPAHERRYGISDSGYQNALHVIRHFGRSFEQTPEAVAHLREPQLRDLFLAALSTYFDSPSGERFRRDGKADIVIEERNQKAFVSECKVWEGIASLEEALLQVTELYTTWQDCKCAILLFNRTRKDITKICDAVNDYLSHHPLTIRTEEVGPGEWHLRMGRRDDANIIMSIQIFLFDVSVKGSEKDPSASMGS